MNNESNFNNTIQVNNIPHGTINNTTSIEEQIARSKGRFNIISIITLLVLITLFIGELVHVSILDMIYPLKDHGVNNIHMRNVEIIGYGLGFYLIAIFMHLLHQKSLQYKDFKHATQLQLKQQKEIHQENIKLERARLQQEKFDNAIRSLGHDKSTVRMGGVYTLMEIARTAKESRKKVFDILCCHIVQQSNIEYDIFNEKYPETAQQDLQTANKFAISSEIQVVIDLLFNRVTSIRPTSEMFKGLVAILEGAKLLGADLSDCNFYSANLKKSNLSRSTFQNSNLKDVDFQNANLRIVNFIGADLEYANMREANLGWVTIRKNSLEACINLSKVQVNGIARIIFVNLDNEYTYIASEQAEELKMSKLSVSEINKARAEDSGVVPIKLKNFLKKVHTHK